MPALLARVAPGRSIDVRFGLKNLAVDKSAYKQSELDMLKVEIQEMKEMMFEQAELIKVLTSK